jgi:hypothetical protein
LRIYHQSAKNNIITQQAKNKLYYDRNRPEPTYRIGDRVLTRLHGTKGKLDPMFSSTPQVIIQAAHPTYIVQDPTSHLEFHVHVSDLRPIITSKILSYHTAYTWHH